MKLKKIKYHYFLSYRAVVVPQPAAQLLLRLKFYKMVLTTKQKCLMILDTDMTLQDANYENAESKSLPVQDIRNLTFVKYAARDY